MAKLTNGRQIKKIKYQNARRKSAYQKNRQPESGEEEEENGGMCEIGRRRESLTLYVKKASLAAISLKLRKYALKRKRNM